jgi:hypothetical protein
MVRTDHFSFALRPLHLASAELSLTILGKYGWGTFQGQGENHPAWEISSAPERPFVSPAEKGQEGWCTTAQQGNWSCRGKRSISYFQEVETLHFVQDDKAKYFSQ